MSHIVWEWHEVHLVYSAGTPPPEGDVLIVASPRFISMFVKRSSCKDAEHAARARA